MVMSWQTMAQSNTSSTVSSTVMDKSPATATSPNIMINQSDSCVVSSGTGGLSTSLFGLAAGSVTIDEACSIRKDAKLLFSMGLKVASVSLLCSSSREIFLAMYRAGSYCPANTGEKAVIGLAAKEYWDAHPEEIPGYEKQAEMTDEEIGLGLGLLGFFLFLL
tara:strand:- start:772 stop:1260 length:489 start_codon:yes stop_codon:yes gene_type:complete